MIQIFRTTALAASLVLVQLSGVANAQSVGVNDTARFLAGMRPSADSPLVTLTQDRSWQQHADRFNAIFAKVDSRQLSRIRTWSSAKLTAPSPVLFYMFSGPDFLYANAFFPNASTYVMSGLEPAGSIPELMKLSGESVRQSLRNIEVSLNSILAYSFFQTIDMRRTLVATRVSGTLPILYVFLARSGKTIRDVSLIRLAEDGSVLPDVGDTAANVGHAARGAKIVFAGEDGQLHTLYYFSTNVANDGFKASGFARFCERLGTGDALVKSASYLMHDNRFSDVRSFLLGHSRLMLQDDTGVPVAYFDQRQWQLRPFGRYTGPIGLFAGRYQPRLTQLFDRADAEPIDFGIGYRWRAQSSNLMLAVRTDAAMPEALASAESGSGVGKVQLMVERPAADSTDAQTGTGVRERKSAHRAAAGRKSATRTGTRAQRFPARSEYFTSWPFWFAR